jgi:hypothetical protein
MRWAFIGAMWVAALARAEAPEAGQTVQPLSVRREVIPEQVRLGEPFVYRVSIEHRASQRWELRTLRDLGSYELLEESRTRQDAGDRSTTTYLLKMALFALGEQVLPTLTFDVVEPDGAAVARIDGADLEGLSSLPKDSEQLGAKLEDIKPNEDVPVRSWRLLWLLAGTAAAIALAVLARRAWLRRAPPQHPPPPPLPLQLRVQRALDALEAEQLPQRGLQREFHFQLSGIVRGYLGERFGFDALECTSGELLREVERRLPPGVDEPALRRFVDQCDVARYARAEVSPAACATALGYARALLQATAPPVSAAGPGGRPETPPERRGSEIAPTVSELPEAAPRAGSPDRSPGASAPRTPGTAGEPPSAERPASVLPPSGEEPPA